MDGGGDARRDKAERRERSSGVGAIEERNYGGDSNKWLHFSIFQRFIKVSFYFSVWEEHLLTLRPEGVKYICSTELVSKPRPNYSATITTRELAGQKITNLGIESSSRRFVVYGVL